MSHYHCEIIIPPMEEAKIKDAIASILAPFDESPEEGEEEDRSGHPFWDFYVIGGRWAGTKLMAKYDPALLTEFNEWCKSEKITVSSLQAGKEELNPPEQIAKVDAKWNKMFPCDPPIKCPMFAHSNDQYGRNNDGTLPDDVLPLNSMPERLSCARVIIAGKSYRDDGSLEARFMLTDEQWNGCNHMPVKWDGSIADALKQYEVKLGYMKPEYADQYRPNGHWLVVTVDYHS